MMNYWLGDSDGVNEGLDDKNEIVEERRRCFCLSAWLAGGRFFAAANKVDSNVAS